MYRGHVTRPAQCPFELEFRNRGTVFQLLCGFNVLDRSLSRYVLRCRIQYATGCSRRHITSLITLPRKGYVFRAYLVCMYLCNIIY